jgi:hypothetical protein
VCQNDTLCAMTSAKITPLSSELGFFIDLYLYFTIASGIDLSDATTGKVFAAVG